MSDVIQSIDVDADLRTVYNQWTQFEDFPRFMEGVEHVEQLDDRHLHWVVDLAGIDREFDAEITEQKPDERVAWKATTGVDQAGVVTFHRLGDNHTRVTLQMKFEPQGAAEHVGDKLGIVTRRARGDLDRFKDFIEGRGTETGGWRGEIPRRDEGGRPIDRSPAEPGAEGTNVVDGGDIAQGVPGNGA